MLTATVSASAAPMEIETTEAYRKRERSAAARYNGMAAIPAAANTGSVTASRSILSFGQKPGTPHSALPSVASTAAIPVTSQKPNRNRCAQTLWRSNWRLMPSSTAHSTSHPIW